MNKKIKIQWKKSWFKQLFCKHDFQYFKAKQTGAMLVSGEYRYLICSKCGKYRGKIFLEYEGMWFK